MTYKELEFILNSLPGAVYTEGGVPYAKTWETDRIRIKHHPYSGSWYLRARSFSEGRSNVTFKLTTVADFCMECG